MWRRAPLRIHRLRRVHKLRRRPLTTPLRQAVRKHWRGMLGTLASRIAVPGVTGTIGRGVAERLAAAGVPQRLVVRDPTRAPQLPAADVRVASYADFESARTALGGVETLFMVSAAEAPARLSQH